MAKVCHPVPAPLQVIAPSLLAGPAPFLCRFCRQPDGPFNAVEHPIPESLGNDDLIIPRGWICDSCNHYFGAKVEQKAAALPPFSIERSLFSVPSKKRQLPRHQGDGSALAPTAVGGQLAI